MDEHMNLETIIAVGIDSISGTAITKQVAECDRKELLKYCMACKTPPGLLASTWQAWSKAQLREWICDDIIPNAVPVPYDYKEPHFAAKADKDKLSAVAKALEELMGTAPKADIDESRVIELIKKHAATTITFEYVKDSEIKRSSSKQHYLFPLVIKLLQARVNTYLWGSFGTGKTVIAIEAAKLMGLDYQVATFSPQSSESSLTGYMWGDKYISSQVRDAMENGKLLILDEADACNPSIFLKLCAALSSRTMSFPDGKRIDAHENFCVIAGGNTQMNGATTAAKGRSAQDGAILDRFYMLKVDIDPSLEAHFAGIEESQEPVDYTAGGEVKPEDWLYRVRKARAVQEKLSIPCTISPRATKIGCDLIKHGIGKAWLDSGILYRGLTSDQVSRMTKELN
jgi:hypothetical protein